MTTKASLKVREYQKRLEEMGLCRYCAEPAIEGKKMCEPCMIKARLYNRKKYRRKVGIPLNAELRKSGRPRFHTKGPLPPGCVRAYEFRRNLHQMLSNDAEMIIYAWDKPIAKVTIQKLPMIGKTTSEKFQSLETAP
jgi:hypothetical protein